MASTRLTALQQIKIVDEHYERILKEWADTTASALLLSYLDEQENDNSVLIWSLFHSAPLRICKLWGLQGDGHPSCLKNMSRLVNKSFLYETLKTEMIDRWGHIRNRSIAHYSPHLHVPTATITDLMIVCILMGYYLEALGQAIKSRLVHSTAMVYPFMSTHEKMFNDFNCVINVEHNLLVLIEKLLAPPYSAANLKNYITIADTTGIYLHGVLVRESHKKQVWQLYNRHKKEALLFYLRNMLSAVNLKKFKKR